MLELFIDNIFVMFGGCVFQQTAGIPIGTNCAPLCTYLFLYVQGRHHSGASLEKLARSFNFRFSYISVLSRTEKGHGIFFFLKGTLCVEFTKKGT